jgi:hypothetical protein
VAVAYDFDKLTRAVDWSVRQMATPRKERLAAVEQYVGSHYAGGGPEKRVPVNLLELLATIYVQHLAARAPRVMVSTHVDSLKPFARNMELALNQIPGEIGLGSTLRRAVQEALFGLGVVKVGISRGGEKYEGNDVGESFVDLVQLDDYFVDMSAKSRETIAFEGNDYWLTLEEAREIAGGSELQADGHTITGDQGQARAEGVSGAEGADVYGDRVHLRDVWLPRTCEVVTYAVTSKKELRKVAWDGPECGPYHILGFADVPGNLLPLPTVATLRDLHELGNLVFRKLAKQAEAKKTVVTFAGGADNDAAATALKEASDGHGIKWAGQKPETITVGGIDAESLAFYLQVYEQFNRLAGNLDSLGGLGPSAETASQENAIGQAASARMASMKARTIDFARGVWKALAWFEWTNPVRKRTIRKPVEGTDIVLTREWSAETRDGDFLDFNFDVDPYSMEEDTPAIKLQKIKAVFLEVVLPALPMMQQQGAQVDFRKLIELFARLGNVDELRGLVQFGEPIQGDAASGGSGAPSFKPANTTRTYERVSRAAPTRSAKDGIMSRALMGLGVQGSERASIGGAS